MPETLGKNPNLISVEGTMKVHRGRMMFRHENQVKKMAKSYRSNKEREGSRNKGEQIWKDTGVKCREKLFVFLLFYYSFCLAL